MTKIVNVLISLVIVFSALAEAQQAQAGTGEFDIGKVRAAVLSQQDTSLGEYSPLEKKSENYAFVMLRITLYLGLVIAIIFGVAWIVRKTGITGSSRIGGGGAMDVLEILPFGQNRNAVLVRVMDAVYLLGQTPNSIVLLEKIEGQKAIDLIASSKGGGSVMQFKDAFNSFIGKIKKPV